ncbi:MAG: L,D-transpeptidase family protein [Chromatiaceae bacterium]|nr:L,D-transpeptidase family protein [Gammaproteobacteria bacterium]MCP5301236.1 L,D-transpeptidase family protein [Chromatiaceae bacterium]MCP5421292.1 L,D-transpeptidase family protein [Chromatiaceae bacterium]
MRVLPRTAKAFALAGGLSIAVQPVPGFSGEAYCFNAGIAKGWDCSESSEAELPIDHVYHTLKIRVAKGQNADDLGRILPIEQVGEVPLPDGDRVVFLGRFRDSMKAFRVVERCREIHSEECARYAPKVVKIGLDDKDVEPGSTEITRADMQNKAANQLVAARAEPVDLSPRVVDDAITESIGTLQPRGLLALPASMKHVLWVDLAEGNMYVVRQEDGRFITAETISVSIGKNGYGKVEQGDKKTPVGVYRLLAHLTDEQLDDFYGSGAYTLNYPNFVDQINSRSGSGIWLHGLPKGKDHRPLQDSDGCVVLSNDMLDDIGRYVDLQNTPIVLDDRLAWVDATVARAERDGLERAIDSWRQAWSARDNQKYLSFYADDFTSLDKNIDEWRSYKTRVNGSKSYIRVNLSDVSLLAYPGEDNTVLARFFQRYESSNFNAKGWKEQLWRKQDSGEWRIVFERG